MERTLGAIGLTIGVVMIGISVTSASWGLGVLVGAGLAVAGWERLTDQRSRYDGMDAQLVPIEVARRRRAGR